MASLKYSAWHEFCVGHLTFCGFLQLLVFYSLIHIFTVTPFIVPTSPSTLSFIRFYSVFHLPYVNKPKYLSELHGNWQLIELFSFLPFLLLLANFTFLHNKKTSDYTRWCPSLSSLTFFSLPVSPSPPWLSADKCLWWPRYWALLSLPHQEEGELRVESRRRRWKVSGSRRAAGH